MANLKLAAVLILILVFIILTEAASPKRGCQNIEDYENLNYRGEKAATGLVLLLYILGGIVAGLIFLVFLIGIWMLCMIYCRDILMLAQTNYSGGPSA